MGELRINLSNFVTVGLIAFVFIFIAKRAGAFVPGLSTLSGMVE